MKRKIRCGQISSSLNLHWCGVKLWFHKVITCLLNIMLQSRNQIVNNRLSRSLQNINYSQWERKKTCLPRSGEKSLQDTRDRNEKKPSAIPHQPMVFKMPPIIDKHGSLGHRNDTTQLSFLVGRPSAKPKGNLARREVFKTKRQLKEEEENRTLLKLKITCNSIYMVYLLVDLEAKKLANKIMRNYQRAFFKL